MKQPEPLTPIRRQALNQLIPSIVFYSTDGFLGYLIVLQNRLSIQIIDAFIINILRGRSLFLLTMVNTLLTKRKGGIKIAFIVLNYSLLISIIIGINQQEIADNFSNPMILRL